MNRRQWGTALLITGLVLLVWTPVQAKWVQVSGSEGAPDITLADPGPQRIVMDIQLPGFHTETVQIDGHPYAKIVLPGHVQLLSKGYPQLPVISRRLLLPDVGEVSVRVLARDVVEIPTDPIVPSKGDLPRSVDPAKVPYEFAPLYAEGGVWPAEDVELGQPFIMRDLRGVAVHVYPLRYDAGRHVLQVLRSIQLEVVTTGTGGINPKLGQRHGLDPQFRRIYSDLFLNYAPDKYEPIPRPGPMLVICNDALVSAASPFVEWKMQRGIPVEVLTTSEAGGTAAGIQSAITTRYESADGLTYVVLVGDLAQVPTNQGTVESYADSDPRYAMVDGSDSYPDLFISRISASTPTEVTLQVNKFIRYERDPDVGGDAAWYHMATGIASNESGGTGIYDYERCDLLRDDLLGYTFTDVDQIYQGLGGSTSAISAAINDGRSLVNYIGHGSGTSWGSVPFTSGDVHALSNGWMQPWIVDVSCSNGDFSLTECFAEAWLRAGTVSEPDGAVGMYSASTSASWVPPCVMQAEVVDLLVAETENTLGALYFSGGMMALDTYPPPGTEGRKLIEQYNIFGDCSLVVRTDVPQTLAVTHAAVIPLLAPTFSVDVAGTAGATVCLYRNGVIHGTAVTDAGGHAEVTLDVPVDTVGEVTLTVTAYNAVPYVAQLQAIVPATVIFDPDTIPAGVPTDVTVTVYGSDGMTPQVGIDVWAEGLSYSTPPVATDENGQAVLTIDYPYGPSVDIAGQDPAETYRLFTEPLAVTALPLTSPDLWVTTDIGLVDAFPLNLPATLHAQVGEPGHTLYALLPGGGQLSTADTTLSITAAATGQVTGIIGVDGHDLYAEVFDVIEAHGTLSGTITGGGTPLTGVTIEGYGDDPTPVFTAVTNGSGVFTVEDELLVDTYTLIVDHFGYLHHEESYFLNYGANVHDIDLTLAPAGTLGGTVTASDTGLPLAADLQVFRSDTGELYATASSSETDGSYEIAALPYFDYLVTVRAWHRIPVSVEVTIDQPAVSKDFVLEPTIGNLLVIEDVDKSGGQQLPTKEVTKYDGAVQIPIYDQDDVRSADEIAADLENLGYTVTQENITTTDPGTWADYDCLVFAAGGNQSPLTSGLFRTELESFVLAGGHLLVEGGEVGYRALSSPGYPSFAANVLHAADWNHDNSGNVTIADPTHYVASVPNAIASPVTLSYTAYGDADAMTPATDAATVGSWSSYPSDASIIAYDPNPDPQGGQLVYFAFNYLALNATARVQLLENAVTWLLTEEVGDAGVSGTAQLTGWATHSGILVEARPSGQSVVTGPSGDFSFEGLFAGTYQITASKDGWSTEIAEVTLAAGEHLTGVSLVLEPEVTEEFCRSPGLAIPDYNSTGVRDTLAVDITADLARVEVFVDITHTYQGDLTIDLSSPGGTTVRLHNRTGGSADDIYGWYPEELTPAGDLDDFVGENPQGGWVLTVADLASADTGTLNSWCLRIVYGGGLTDVVGDESLPQRTALAGNYPNPFNPRTKISFALARNEQVDLAIYDMRGRLVRTLVSEPLAAGQHEVVWNGTDEGGRQVSSGLYVYRLRAGVTVESRKMMLMK
jgi:subtilisin-like proprotein convertase family protein